MTEKEKKEHTQQEPNVVHGIVAMLDALGVRNATTREASSFIKEFQKLMHKIPSTFVQLLDFTKRSYPREQFHLHTFGDTVIIVWEVPDTDEKLRVLLLMSVLLSIIIVRGLEGELRLRGAISMGEIVYYGDPNSHNILGPAIADVASWYEIPEFIGIVATPTCGQQLSYIENWKKELWENGKVGSLESFFKRYRVPIKGDAFRKLWAVNWPRVIGILNKGKEPLEWYFDCTRKFSIPIGTEKKYDNTEKFIIKLLNLKKDKKKEEKEGPVSFYK